MNKRVIGTVALFLAGVVTFAQQHQSRGVPARSKPDQYTAHLSVAGVSYAASLVPAAEVKRLFAFDISKNYAVFEVALYPQTDVPMKLDPEGFVVRISQNTEPVRRADSVTVASVIQQKNLPPPPYKSSGPVAVSAATEVGYESGRDPYTGQKTHGTYTASQVGVATGGGENAPRPSPNPGGYPRDRELLENQLWDKSLPEGQIRQPTAGYLYFPAALLKKKTGAAYELEYLGAEHEPQLTGVPSNGKIQLQIPAKSR
jgi:hypothetical protein